jgi:sugar transferase (PEP-CTERM/EpsH1 system associated)
MTIKKKTHVCHIIYALKTGGLENGLVNLINELPEHKFKHSIICLTNYDDFSKRINRNDVEIISMHKKPGQDFGMYLRLYKKMKMLQPDIVHTRNMTAIESQIPAFLAGIKVRIHGEHGWDISDPQGKNKKYQWIRKVCSFVIHRFVPLSKELEAYLSDVVCVPKAKITRICNGVDAVRFSPKVVTENFPFASSLSVNSIVIGSVGRMEVIKNPEVLAKAFVTLNKKLSQDVFLVMIGGGSELEKIKSILEKEKLLDKCWLPGDCTNIGDLMLGFDIFCLPSRAEGISNTLLEAMACGLPVVATKVGGNADIALDGETAILVKSESAKELVEALSVYVNDESLRKKHGKAGRQRIESSLSLKKMVLNYEAMYLNEINNLHQEVA